MQESWWFSHRKKAKGNHVTCPFTNGHELPQEKTSSLIERGELGFLGQLLCLAYPCILDRLTILFIFQRRKKGAINDVIWGKLVCVVNLAEKILFISYSV